MLNTSSFIKYIVIIFIDVFIIVNIIFAFDLANSLPSVWAGGVAEDLPNRYFGVSSLIDGFEAYFGNNTWLTSMKEDLDSFYETFQKLNIANYLDVVFPNVSGNYDIANYLFGLLSVINFFLNIAYQIMLLFYGLFLFVYVISIVVNFVIFIVALASGYMSTELPHTYGLHACMMTMIAQLPL